MHKHNWHIHGIRLAPQRVLLPKQARRTQIVLLMHCRLYCLLVKLDRINEAGCQPYSCWSCFGLRPPVAWLCALRVLEWGVEVRGVFCFVSCLPVCSFACLLSSCPVLCDLVLSCHVLSCHVLSCHVMCCPVMACLPCPALSCPVLSWCVLS